MANCVACGSASGSEMRRLSVARETNASVSSGLPEVVMRATLVLFVLAGAACSATATQAVSPDGTLGTCYHHVNPEKVN